MKRFSFFITALFISVCSSFSQTSVWNGECNIWTRGAGTQSSPYLIESAGNLAYLAVTGATSGCYYKLTKDINLNNASWTPCDLTNVHFDGANHSIVGLKSSLFKKIISSEISNLRLTVNITGLSREKIGAVAQNINNSTIKNCYTKGSISNASSSSGTYAGGIVGYAQNSTIENCINKCDVTGNCSSVHSGTSVSGTTVYIYGQSFAGGISGCGGTIKCCANFGTIKALNGDQHGSDNNKCYADGISNSSNGLTSNSPVFGYNRGNVYKGTILKNSSQVGTNWYSVPPGVNDASKKTEVFLVQLNNGTSNFVSDVTPNINDGYPILSYQIEIVTTSATINRGESYSFGDSSYTESGTYQYYSASTWGAYKNVLNLTVKEIPIHVYLNVNDTIMGHVEGAGEHYSNQDVRIKANPNYGYHFVNWSDGNTDTLRTIKLGVNDTTLTAFFAINTYSFTVQTNNSALGSVNEEVNGSYEYLTKISINATPQNHCHFVCWSDSSVLNPRIVEINDNTSLTAIFEVNKHSIQVVANNEIAGTVEGFGYYDYNGIAEISAEAYNGYRFIRWSDGDTSNPRSLLVTQDSILIAYFEQCQYLVKVLSADTIMGRVSGGGTFTYGQNTFIAAMPNVGYDFVQWNDGETTPTRSILVTDNMTFTAQFAPRRHIVNLISVDSVMGSVSGSGTYNYGQNVIITANANRGFSFVKWSDENEESVRLLTISEDITLIALFERCQYTLTVLSSDETMGYVQGGGIYPFEQSVEIKAIPKSGYEFIKWSDQNEESIRTIKIIDNISLVAFFRVSESGWRDEQSQVKQTNKVLINNHFYILLPDGTRYDSTGKKLE